MLSRLMTIREQLILAGLAVSILVGTAAMVFLRDSGGTEVVPVSEPAPQTAVVPVAAATPAPVLPAAATSAAAPQTAPPAPPAPPPSPLPAPAPQAIPPEQAPLVTVAIDGAITRPGVYEMPAGARLHDLLKKAGGTEDEADLSDINLTAHLTDGTTLTIPRRLLVSRGANTLSVRRPDPVNNPPQYTRSRAHLAPPASTVVEPSPERATTSTGGDSAQPTAPSDGRIALNSATQQELETLPGIGPAFAKRIMDYRTLHPFRSVEQLKEIPGIGDKRFEALRPLVKVE